MRRLKLAPHTRYKGYALNSTRRVHALPLVAASVAIVVAVGSGELMAYVFAGVLGALMAAYVGEA